MENPETFVQAADLRVLSGQILAATLITNGMSHLLQVARRFVGIVVSALLYVALNWATFEPEAASIIAAICNIFIIYSGAVGVSSMAASETFAKGGGEELKRERFFRSWW